ncbi:MAG TPA: tandem-95 repeat protein, partial [Cellvibrionaceae bacterium]|nr:tandem-95 repeat protein [Cellvibrionaceae bacterium]
KLILQLGEKIKFYDFTSPLSLSAPVLSAGTPDGKSVYLSWTDESLETAFVVQQRVQGTTVWEDLGTTPANAINWLAVNLQGNTTYEFRVRATAADISSPWSNVVTVTTPKTPNKLPIAINDVIPLPSVSRYGFAITENDYDPDGSLDLESIVIVTPPQFGQLTVNKGGQLTYVPNNEFVGSDSFTYTINDNEAATSAPATVTLIYVAPPVLRISNPSSSSVELDWTTNASLAVYQIQQRRLGTSDWLDTQPPYFGETRWVVSGLQGGSTYEFRVNAVSLDTWHVSAWSNTVSATTTTLQQANAAPVAKDDLISLPDFSRYLFSVIANDYDSDGQINPASVTIVSQPQFGQITVNVDGAVTYVPNGNFSQTDSFTYTVKDNKGATSSPATATISYSAAPTLSISNIASDSIKLGWTYPSADLGFQVQQRILNSATWMDIQTTATNAVSWTANNLKPGSTYEFRVRAITSKSTSPWSNVAIATIANETIEPNTNTGRGKKGGSMDFISLLMFGIMFLLYRGRLRGRKL